jgi:nucleotide-binding universal stress UspA family protein
MQISDKYQIRILGWCYLCTGKIQTSKMEKAKKNTVLVPVDFSDIATHALDHAVQVAKQFNNNIALLHVVEEALLSTLLSFGRTDMKVELAREAVETRLKKIADDVKTKHNIDCIVEVRFGRVYREITDAAKELGCDSIIMGSNGAAGLDQIIGSNASRVISHSSVPVVVVKSRQPINGYKSIVFPLDLTIESRQKVKWAVHLGKSYGSTIHILTYQVQDEFLRTKMLASLRQVEKILAENNIPFTQKILEQSGNFADESLTYANEINADLILIMTQQEDKEFSEYIIGTYAQQLVNRSTKPPIMCINPSPTGFIGDWSY